MVTCCPCRETTLDERDFSFPLSCSRYFSPSLIPPIFAYLNRMASQGSLEVPTEEFPTRINYRPNGKPRIVIEHYMPELEAYVPRDAEPLDLNVLREINDRLTAMLEDVRLMKKRLTRIMILQLLCLFVAFSGLFVKLIRK